jgi:xylan 1,4-beta-xylosidase
MRLRATHLAWLLALKLNVGCAVQPPHTYTNPLLPEYGFADPDCIKVGDTYYLYPTYDTKHGYEVFTSKDLVHWKYGARCFSDARGGDWAPDVFYNKRGDGKFYLYYTDNTFGGTDRVADLDHKQIGVAVADSPLGPFKDKQALVTDAIDAHLFQDDDGKMYLYYVHFDNGFKLSAQRMADPTHKEGEPVVALFPTEEWEMRSGWVTEGPFMLKHNGTYYLMYSGSGADTPNYAIGYATSKSPMGPFTKYAGNPIAHRDGNVIGPGHHCVVTGPDGKLWMLYHQKWDDQINFHRFLALDPVWFDEQGVLHARVSRGAPQPAP